MQSYSFLVDHIDGALVHLEHHDVFARGRVARPLSDIEAIRMRMDWRFRCVSSIGSDFNFDYHVSFTEKEMAKGESRQTVTKRIRRLRSGGAAALADRRSIRIAGRIEQKFELKRWLLNCAVVAGSSHASANETPSDDRLPGAMQAPMALGTTVRKGELSDGAPRHSARESNQCCSWCTEAHARELKEAGEPEQRFLSGGVARGALFHRRRTRGSSPRRGRKSDQRPSGPRIR